MRPIDRVFKITQCTSQTELANILRLRQSSVSSVCAKESGEVPVSWLITLLQLKMINPEWILTGIGSIYLVPANKPKKHPGFDINFEDALMCVLSDIKALMAHLTTEELCTEITRRSMMTERALIDKIEGNDKMDVQRVSKEIKIRRAVRAQAGSSGESSFKEPLQSTPSA